MTAPPFASSLVETRVTLLSCFPTQVDSSNVHFNAVYVVSLHCNYKCTYASPLYTDRPVELGADAHTSIYGPVPYTGWSYASVRTQYIRTPGARGRCAHEYTRTREARGRCAQGYKRTRGARSRCAQEYKRTRGARGRCARLSCTYHKCGSNSVVMLSNAQTTNMGSCNLY